MHPNVHSSTICNSQVLEATEVPISKRVYQNTGAFTQWNSTQQIERRSPTLCDSMDGLESSLLSEIRQVVKDKYHMISPISGT